MPNVDAIWDPSNRDGLTIPSLLVDRVLRICSITAGEQPTGVSAEELEELGFADDPGFGLEYEMIPAADPAPPEGAAPDVLGAWSDRNYWWFTAQDDLETEYDAPSGASGLSADGTATRGVLDVYPTPPSEARWIEFTFHGDGYRHEYEEDQGPQFVLRVPLPLPVMTFEEGVSSKMGVSQAQYLAAVRAGQRSMESHAEPERNESFIIWDAPERPGADSG